ncbi:MAG TPA: hypothetical protein GX405_17140 [Rhizobiales bacterium]|nr:hypothetical protein [Hyphomicrobiales bacterium]
MEKIREIALMCVGRAVMFGTLAIGCIMIGFSFNPVSAFRSGAVATLLMATVLMWKALTAMRRNPKSTEVWLYLDETSRPLDQHARFVFGTIMREVYGRYAQFSLLVACALFAISLVFGAFGFEAYDPEAGPHPSMQPAG